MSDTITELLAKYPSDKLSAHSYAPIYQELFEPFRESAMDILELGVMGGNSMRAWRDFFMFANIHGIDNDPNRLVTENRLTSYHCDTTDRDRFLKLCDSLPKFDIIIDDASHVINEQIWAVCSLWNNLKPGGLFIVEDILYPRYLELFTAFQNVTIHDLRHVRSQHDDMLVVIRKSD